MPLAPHANPPPPRPVRNRRIIKKHPAAYEAVSQSLAQGKSVADCLQAAEAADLGQAAADAAAATAQEEKIANETPQERAAREREEMAARGRL